MYSVNNVEDMIYWLLYHQVYGKTDEIMVLYCKCKCYTTEKKI